MIPKIIYQVSIGLNHTHELIQKQIEKTKVLNKNYDYKLITTENEMDDFVNENYKGEIADCYNMLNILVAKVDFWRYLILYKYGGIYLDMDSSINLPLDNLIRDDDESIITAESILELYVQWALIFNKNHPILKKTIELIVDNIKKNKFPNDIHKMTGPTVYTNAINTIHSQLFNNNINHKLINVYTDITFKSNCISYRLYNRDYGNYFSFNYPESYILFIGKKKWTQQQREIPLLRKPFINNK